MKENGRPMNKKILNVAVVGCGPMAKVHHTRALKALDCANLYAVCDDDPKVLDDIYEHIADPKVLKISDYLELVNDEKLDAVIISTPDQLHLEMTEAFLRAGKAVLCEKPMALTAEECIRMMEVERETGGKLTIGQICRYTPGFIKAKELVDAGRIGELTYVESEYAHNYNHSRGNRDWRLHPLRHVVVGGGCHPIDLLRWIAGDPVEVFGYHNHKIMLDWPTPDTAIAVFKFPNDVCGKVFCSSGAKRPYTMRTVLYGTKGTIICDNTSPTLELYTELDENCEWWSKPIVVDIEVNNHNAAKEIEDFVHALANDLPMPVPSIEGAKTVIAACAAVQSMNEGKVVKIEYLEG